MTGSEPSSTERSSRSAARSVDERLGTLYKGPISEGPYVSYLEPSTWYVPVQSVPNQRTASKLVRDLLEPWQRTGYPTRGPVVLNDCPPSCRWDEGCPDHQVRVQCYIYRTIDPYEV